MDNGKYSDELCDILCRMDKIETLLKTLNLALFENNDFKIQDCQNMCLIIQENFHDVKLKTSALENSLNKIVL